MTILGSAYHKTYSIKAPLSTHWVPATCAEMGCNAYRFGWVTTIDPSTELGQRQQHYIMHDRTREYVMEMSLSGLVTFTFGPGQTCFAASQHRRRVPLAELFLAGNRQHVRPADWVEDFAGHLDRVQRDRERG
jgi:hypothetical protein